MNAVFAQAFANISARRSNPTFRTHALGKFMRHVRRQLAERKTVTLFVPLIVESVIAAEGAMWSAGNTVRLLIALQKELDADGVLAVPYIETVIATIRDGRSASAIMTRGCTLSVAKPRAS